MPEQRPVNTLTSSDRLKLEAAQLRLEAERRPPGPERDKLIREAGQLETALRLANWVSSPGLKPPT